MEQNYLYVVPQMSDSYVLESVAPLSLDEPGFYFRQISRGYSVRTTPPPPPPNTLH